jgi:hypothetical protein
MIMFDLEKSIAEWRRQMLAAGIQSPVPLEELELHLREEIERQFKSGLHEAKAFHLAIQKIGRPDSLRREFKKSVGFVEFLRQHRTSKLHVILGLIWLALNGYGLWEMGPRAFSGVHDSAALVSAWIFLSGMVGSALLIGNSKLGRSIIRTNGLIFLGAGFLAYATGLGKFSSSFDTSSFISLCVLSIFILHLPGRTDSKPAN